MATELQEKLARNIIKNAKRKRPLNKKDLVLSSGYGVVTADRHASEVIEQKGVQDTLQDLGFDPDSAKRVVCSILAKETAKDEVRLRAADMIFEVHGTYAPTKSIVATVDLEVAPAIKKLADELLSQQRGAEAGSGGLSEPVGSTAPDEERGGVATGVREEEVPGGHI